MGFPRPEQDTLLQPCLWSNAPGFPELLSKANYHPPNPPDFSHAFLWVQATSPNSSFRLFITEEKLPIYVE